MDGSSEHKHLKNIKLREPPRQFRQPNSGDVSVLMTPTDHEMTKVIMDYSIENRQRMPVRVEMAKARGFFVMLKIP